MGKETLQKIVNNKIGWIELITGCMFSGKTEEFIRRIKRYKYAKKNIVVFKPKIDDRYDKDFITTHNGQKLESYIASNSKEIDKKIKEIINKKTIDVVGIDEIQFFDNGIVNLIQELADSGIIVIVTGLDKDFKLMPFKNVDQILVHAEFVTKLMALCNICGNFANRSQRIIDGKLASLDSPVILVDGDESYQARCRKCYIKIEVK